MAEPYPQAACLPQVEVKDADIKMQGVSLHDLLEKYFVAPELGLLDDAYWADYKGFNIFLHVSMQAFSLETISYTNLLLPLTCSH